MELEKQVCDLKYAKQLNKLDIEQNGIFTWLEPVRTKTEPWIVRSRDLDDKYRQKYYSAFTATELMEILPVYIESEYTQNNPDISKLTINKFDDGYKVSYLYTEKMDKKAANALAKMLIYILKKYLKV